MYVDNLVLDYENKIKIPQNSDSFFKINASNLIKNSIEIKIQAYEDINILNLYLIIKSYSCNLIYMPFNFLIIIKNKEESEFIAYNANIIEFKNLSYYGFLEWFYKQLNQDWRYVKKDGEYLYVFTYTSLLFDLEFLAYLKPKYPWNSNILEKLTKLKLTEEYYIDTINNQKIEIEKLKNIIIELKKKK